MRRVLYNPLNLCASSNDKHKAKAKRRASFAPHLLIIQLVFARYSPPYLWLKIVSPWCPLPISLPLQPIIFLPLSAVINIRGLSPLYVQWIILAAPSGVFLGLKKASHCTQIWYLGMLWSWEKVLGYWSALGVSLGRKKRGLEMPQS